MNTAFWAPYISDSAVRAICWTLIHSLWIGMITALLAGIIISLTRKSAAAFRYRLLCAVLVLFAVSIGITYVIEANSTTPITVTKDHANVFINVINATPYNAPAAPASQSLLDRSKEFLNQNMSIIFMVWLLFFLLKSLKMVSGLLYIQRIRTYKTHAVTEELKHKIEQFSDQIGIRRAVRLVQSELVKVPVAVGWLKPMILLPLGIAFQMTPEQLDGILWHELAHIHRRDYLVNILQGLVETVFFFNPGLLWLSSLIRTEREACCDDMVLSRMNHKANYLEALLSFGYGEFSQARYAMSIGSGNQLRDRLKRMISQENKRLSVAEKSVLAVGLMLLLMLNVMPKASAIAGRMHISFKKAALRSANHDSSEKEQVEVARLIAYHPKADTNKLRGRDTTITFTSVLFKNSDADPANNDISAMDTKGNTYHFVLADNKIIAMEINGVKVDDDKRASYDYMVAYIERELAEKKRVRLEDRARFQSMSPTERLEVMKQQRTSDSMKAMRHVEAKYSADQMPQAKFMKMQQRMHYDSLNYGAELKRMEDIIADLVHDKVILNADAVTWFGLSNTEFIVNGQKQPDEMQRRYKAKYGVHEGWGLYYGPVQMTGRGVFIDLTAMGPDRMPKPPRPPRPQKPMPPYTGSLQGLSDTNTRKYQMLMEKQKRFMAEQDGQRQEIERQQQIQIAEQARGLKELTQKQQNYVAEQDADRQKLQQQALLARQIERMKWLKRDIDLQPAISGVIADLVSANVISDKSELSSFSLTNKALIVNGKKQAEDIHEKLKSKYLDLSAYPGNGDGMDWNRIKDDPNFGLHFDTSGGEGLGIMGKRYSQ